MATPQHSIQHTNQRDHHYFKVQVKKVQCPFKNSARATTMNEGKITDEIILCVEESSRLIAPKAKPSIRRKKLGWISLPNWVVSSHPIVIFVIVFGLPLMFCLLTILFLSRETIWGGYGNYKNESLKMECPIQVDPIHQLKSHSMST
jgi:hypothetical protein